jgi:lysozyme
MTRRINKAGLWHIQSWEGCKLTAYKDIAGVWTIGYGSTGKHVKPGMKISPEEAEDLLRRDLDRFEKRVETLVKVPLSDNQFAALVSFDFNTGALHKSTLLKKLNAGDYKAVPSELMKWVKAKVNGKLTTVKGLQNRRASEAEMWKSTKVSQPKPSVVAHDPWTPSRVPLPPVSNPPKDTPVKTVERKHWLVELFSKLFARWL